MNPPRVLVTLDELRRVLVTHTEEPLAEPYPLTLPDIGDFSGGGEIEDVREYGNTLFRALLGPVWEKIVTLPAVSAAKGVEIALKLHGPVRRLAWEAMHLDGRPLIAQPECLVAVTRIVTGRAEPPQTIVRTPRVLFATGSDVTDPAIRPGAMFLGLLRECESQGLAATRIAPGVNLHQLREVCEAFMPDLIHLVAHGELDDDDQTWIRLGGETVSGNQLARAITSGTRTPVAVLLSVCHSGTAASGRTGDTVTTGGPDRTASLAEHLIDSGVSFVAAMAGEIGEHTCRLFSRRFLGALLTGDAVAEAVAHARRAALPTQVDPATGLYWAMPTLFAAEAVPPAFRTVDPSHAQALREKAKQLDLLQAPVYIGRLQIFETVDELAGPRGGIGFLAATTGSDFAKLGSTRLLREIGYRLLQRGHLPLLLAPYNEGNAPQNLRQVVAKLLTTMIITAQRLGLPPEPPRTVNRELRLGRPPAASVWQGLKQAVAEFGGSETTLTQIDVQDPLAEDLVRLAQAAEEQLGKPFGPHTQAVVLAEGLHLWHGALGWTERNPGLLDLVTPNGLGTPERPAPLIATAALLQATPLHAYQEEHAGKDWFRQVSFEPLSDDEATLGYQWILLHAWHTKPRYRNAYWLRPGYELDIFRNHIRKRVGGHPGHVLTKLYDLVELLVDNRDILLHDDEAAWRLYAKRHGLGQDTSGQRRPGEHNLGQ
ncbi:CHAT domain-containing protein [Rhizohabitans arisaemae]|uniref:CHAT domain-containing protein n=1 Tax=Rhizohabitans arisaemae TaxID=2720610 RepID=UPI0024B1E640|nr:CHAT domain-containing protein [Rhizohabitans arisaemae]